MTITLVTALIISGLLTVGPASGSPGAWQWRYRVWMPAHWQRLAQCEEGLNWRFRGGGYEGAFAFAASTWDGYRPAWYPASAADATPWQQWRVALVVARSVRGGIGAAWGCWRGAEHAWVRGGLPEWGVTR